MNRVTRKISFVTVMLFFVHGCAGMMPPKYQSVTEGPVSEVTFVAPAGSVRLRSGNRVEISGYADYSIYRCRTVNWDNMQGYVEVRAKENPSQTVNVRAGEPVLLRVIVDATEQPKPERYTTNITHLRVIGTMYLSFLPEEGEKYLVHTVFHEKFDPGKQPKNISEWKAYPDDYSLHVVVDKEDRQTRLRKRVDVQRPSFTGLGIRHSPHVVDGWPECS